MHAIWRLSADLTLTLQLGVIGFAFLLAPAPASTAVAVDTGVLLGTSRWLAGAPGAKDHGAPVRFVIADGVVDDVSPDGAWIKRLTQAPKVVIDPKLLNTTLEIVNRSRKGQLDAMPVSTLEYQQITKLSDSAQIVTSAGAAGQEQYRRLLKAPGDGLEPVAGQLDAAKERP